MTTVTEPEPSTVTDPATAPLWHARRVTAGAAPNATEALAALRTFGLMPDQLAGESAELLKIVDFDDARAINEQKDEEPHMATDLDTAPPLDMSPSAVRAWAKTRDLDVSPKGMVPRSITEAYVAADGIPGTIPVEPTPTDDEIADEIDAAFAEPEDVTPEPETVTVAPATVTPAPEAVTVEPDPVTVAPLAPGGWPAVDHYDQVRVHLADGGTLVLSEPLPEDIRDLLDAWNRLFGKASDLNSRVAHTLAEVAAPALVNEATDQIHDLIRLLDGDTAP